MYTQILANKHLFITNQHETINCMQSHIQDRAKNLWF